MPAGTVAGCLGPAQSTQLPGVGHQRPVRAHAALRPSGETAMLRRRARGHISRGTTGLGEWREIRWAQKPGCLLLRAGCRGLAFLPQSCQHPTPLRERPLQKGGAPPLSGSPLHWALQPPRIPTLTCGRGVHQGPPDVGIAGPGGGGQPSVVLNSGWGYADLPFCSRGLCV